MYSYYNYPWTRHYFESIMIIPLADQVVTSLAINPPNESGLKKTYTAFERFLKDFVPDLVWNHILKYQILLKTVESWALIITNRTFGLSNGDTKSENVSKSGSGLRMHELPSGVWHFTKVHHPCSNSFTVQPRHFKVTLHMHK